MKLLNVLVVTAFAALLVSSCKKESFINSPDARLFTSADTLKFDTVFTTVGSITQSFKIFNDNDQKLRLSKVKLMGGSASAYKININGIAASEADDIEIAANDSIYVFVAVTIDPNAANLPFIISDSVLIRYNGNDRFVQLQAYGQNAHFLDNEVISTDTAWPNDLPYVILGGLQVDTNVNLLISRGCRIYLHANAPFIVDGTVIADGKKGEEVRFASDRLDEPYRDFPAGWPGIYFRNSSHDNQLRFTVIKNAYQAVVAEGPSPNANPKLTLHQCIIDNAYDAGLLGINSSVRADNTLISNCGKNINIALGGDYEFSNCTAASYSTNYMLHKFPVLIASNAAEQNGSIITANMNAVFRNCIFWGDNDNVENEVVVNREGSSPFNVLFDHSLYKAVTEPASATFLAPIRNADPLFDSIDIGNRYFNFRTSKDPMAPGINQGTATSFTKDLDDNDRAVGITDLGSYEKQ